jgi:hypothetical protein
MNVNWTLVGMGDHVKICCIVFNVTAPVVTKVSDVSTTLMSALPFHVKMMEHA